MSKSDEKERNIGKLIHDINSGLFSIQQAIDLITDNLHKDVHFVDGILPIAKRKMDIILTDWEVLKSKIKS